MQFFLNYKIVICKLDVLSTLENTFPGSNQLLSD